MKILMLYPEFPDTFWSFKHALKFVNKKVSNPPLGLLTVAAMLPQDWDIRLIDLNISILKTTDLDWADMIFLSAMDVQRASVQDIITRCKRQKKTIVAGGPLFTGDYLSFPEIDYFVLNEAELTLPPFLKDLENGTLQRVYQTTEYADITQTPMPRWDLIKFKNYDSINVQFTRGCPYQCDFCNVTALLGHRPRYKTTAQIIGELEQIYQRGWRRNVFFVDDNFIGNKKILKQEILPALTEWRKGKTGFRFITEASINLADDDELLDLMVKAGFLSVFIGVETPDEDSLTECNKSQNKHRDLIALVKKMQNAGLQVMAGFIVGFDSDTSTIFDRQIKFIQDSGIVTAMVGLLQAPAGTELYQRMKREGRLLHEMSGDNADGTTNIVPKMDADVLRNGYLHIIESIYSPKLFYQRVKTFLKEFKPQKAPVGIEWNEIYAFLRSVVVLGILGKERREYWDLFFWTLIHYPQSFAFAITLTIYGYHFRRVSELHIFNQVPVVKPRPPRPSTELRQTNALP